MKNKREVFKAFSMIMQIGLTMLVSIFLCGAVGYFVDNHFGTNLMIFFIAFGVISGYCGTYSMLSQFIGTKSNKQAQYFAEYLEDDPWAENIQNNNQDNNQNNNKIEGNVHEEADRTDEEN